MFQATRRRLALWYTTLTAVLLLLFAVSFYFYVRHTLIERIDDTLSHVAEVVERSLVIEPAPDGLIWMLDGQVSQQVNVEASFRNNILFANDDDHIDLEWFNNQGKLLWSTFSEPLALPLHRENRWLVSDRHKGETVTIQPGPYGEEALLRQMTVSVQIGRQVLGYLRVSHPWFEVTKPTQQLVWDLAAGLVLVLGAVTATGWFLSGLAMRPVQESYQRLRQFTADASHELRNPIAIIQTNIQATLADPVADAHLQQQLQVVERLTRRLGRLVDDLLFLARQDSGILQTPWGWVELEGLLLEVVEEQTANASDRGVQLTIELPETELITRETSSQGREYAADRQPDPEQTTQAPFLSQGSLDSPHLGTSRAKTTHPAPLDFQADAPSPTESQGLKPYGSNHGSGPGQVPEQDSPGTLKNLEAIEDLEMVEVQIQGDREQLARLFTNLISNGLQYTPAGGQVQVALQRALPLTVRGKLIPSWSVTVTDTGSGIAPEDLPHVFDRFYRADPARSHQQTQGSGLGLAIVAAIVQAHQGQVEVRSTLNQGTCFTVTLPTQPPLPTHLSPGGDIPGHLD
ncbi:MAG: HAMP domain-containing sensor histidine kinase [Prochlorothrix sp.]|nr:HAMP domain-containing sensor histidine kinase [Prochlorothrix sp.]